MSVPFALSRESGERQRSRRRRTSIVVASAVAALTVGLLVPLAPGSIDSAAADTAPAVPTDPKTPETVSTDVLPTPQIGDGLSNGKDDTKGAGVVWDQVVIGDTVYVGGDFKNARPAGAGKGEKVVPRSNFLAYNLKTGELLDYAPSFNGQVRSLAASPDGKRLYVGGSFTSVGGQTRYRLAAFDVATGQLVADFAPYINARVTAIVATGSTVYAAGALTQAQAQPRAGFAAFASAGAGLLPWAPVAAGGLPAAMVLSPDGSKLVVGGSFTSLNGSSQPGYGMGAVEATGTATTVLPWKVNALVRNAGELSGVTSLTSDGASVYATAYMNTTNHEGLESVVKASWADGTMEWKSDCHGDTYSVAVAGDAVYSTGHAHGCEGIGGFPEGSKSVTSDTWHRALAFSKATTGVLKPWTAVGHYGNFGGQPSPSLLDWYPEIPAGTFTGMSQGAWDVTTAQGYVLIGGEFPSVNGVKQQGLVRFAPKSIAPNKDKPQLENAAMKPTVGEFGGSYVKMSWAANYDRDNAMLTYQVIRDENTAKPVFQTTVASRFWQRPTIRATDGPLTPGKTYSYRIRTIDPFGNVKWGDSTSYTVPAKPYWAPEEYITSYDRAVLQDQPAAYWSMNDTQGVAHGHDWVGDNHISTLTNRTAGIAGGKATTFNGNRQFAATGIQQSIPTEYSAEMWVQTRTTTGGLLMGFANQRSAGAGRWEQSTTTAERELYMEDSGRITFAIYDPAGRKFAWATSPKSYNDGAWHQVATTLTPTGLELYVDGVRVGQAATGFEYMQFTGYWILGGHDMYLRPNRPTSNDFAGSIDNFAFYRGVVPAETFARHFQLGASMTPNSVPTASFITTSSGLSVSTDGAGSVDTDGSVASYEWSFGDGSTGSGVAASHVYAKAGTYPVSLTVVDDKGARSVAVSKSVTVSVAGGPQPQPQPQPGVVAQDAFERSVASGWGSATAGGAWTTGNGSTAAVVGGVGTLTGVKGQTSGVALAGASSVSSDTTVSFRMNNAPTGGGQYASFTGRQVGADSYTARVWVRANGVAQLQLQRSGTTISAVDLTEMLYKAGDAVNVRFQVTGTGTTTLQAKVWTTGAEPAGWTKTVTDTTAALQKAGTLGLGMYVSSSATAPSTVSFDNYTVKEVSP